MSPAKVQKGRPRGVVSLDQAVDKLKSARKAVEEALDRVERYHKRIEEIRKRTRQKTY